MTRARRLPQPAGQATGPLRDRDGPDASHSPASQRRGAARYEQRIIARRYAVHREADRLGRKFRGSGGDRDGERAAHHRDARSIGAADRNRRGIAGGGSSLDCRIDPRIQRRWRNRLSENDTRADASSSRSSHSHRSSARCAFDRAILRPQIAIAPMRGAMRHPFPAPP